MNDKNPQINEAKDINEIEKCFVTMQHLRPHLKKSVFVSQIQRQIAAGYHLMYIKDDNINNESVSLLGYRINEYLAWGKILYIDDFITSPNARGKGYGNAMLNWVLDKAQNEKCDQIHLDTGIQRHDAHKLYLNKGFKLSSFHMAAKI